MATYRYYIKYLVGDAFVTDIELYGVSCNRAINTAGQFQGTFKLNPDTPMLNSIYLSATNPGMFALYMERNGTLIWGGILWSRTYSSADQAMTIYASTFESYFDHMTFNEAHFIQQNIAQENIIANALTQLQGQANSNIGITTATLPNSGIKRTVLIPSYEYHFGTDAI